MKIIGVDRAELVRLMNACFGRVEYELGAKAPALSCKPEQINAIDCSGFVRWLIYNATHGQVTMPDGSQNQLAFCRKSDYKSTDYDNTSLLDNRLRIAFMSPAHGQQWPRHVWLIINGQTIESYGGHGPGRRTWNNHILKPVSACFVLTNPLK